MTNKMFKSSLKGLLIGGVLRRRVARKDFTIISNNCWGGRVYQDFNLPYLSPFAGLFLHGPCYIKLLNNLREALSSQIRFTTISKYDNINDEIRAGFRPEYPIGLLMDDIEVHFLHYLSEAEALEKWNRRVERINWSNIYVKFCDRDGCTKDLIEEFDKLDFQNKVCFTAKPYPHLKSVVLLKNSQGLEHVEDELTMYKRYFDVADWLNCKTGRTGVINMLKSIFTREYGFLEFILAMESRVINFFYTTKIVENQRKRKSLAGLSSGI